jgi:hypothetical protein
MSCVMSLSCNKKLFSWIHRHKGVTLANACIKSWQCSFNLCNETLHTVPHHLFPPPPPHYPFIWFFLPFPTSLSRPGFSLEAMYSSYFNTNGRVWVGFKRKSPFAPRSAQLWPAGLPLCSHLSVLQHVYNIWPPVPPPFLLWFGPNTCLVSLQRNISRIKETGMLIKQRIGSESLLSPKMLMPNTTTSSRRLFLLLISGCPNAKTKKHIYVVITYRAEYM